MKTKVRAFSYVELLFGMMIVCIIFISAIPFLTRKASTVNASSGEFQCYTAFNGTEFRLFERMKRGEGEFSAPVDVTNTGCKFFKQKNVNTYNLQIIGGGGGGSRSRVSGTGAYSNVSVERAQKGQNGKSISVQTTLGGVWDENGVLTIYKCQNADENVPQTDPYREEYLYCVGDGGFAKNSVSGIGKVGGRGVKEMDYWSLLGVYHDILFNSKTNVNSIQYAGRGNGTVTSDDDLTKVRRILGESHSVYINLNNYLKSGSTDIQSLRNAAGQLLTVIKSWSFKTTDSEGGAGGYSRFVLKDYSDIDCINGNCLAKGGDGATGNTLVNCSSAMVTYTTAFCNVNSLDNKCSCSLSSNNKDLYSCLYNKSASSSVFNCNASSTNVLGAGGGAGSGAYLSNGYSMQGYGGIGGGGAIIIKW